MTETGALQPWRRRARGVADSSSSGGLSCRRAKHRSLTGHARMARRLASLIPFYEYDERSSSAPTTRRTRSPRAAATASCGLPRSTATRFAETARADRRGGRRHLRPAVHRRLPRAVPVQPLRARAPARRLVRASRPPASRSPISTATASTTSPAPTASTCSATTSTRSAWSAAQQRVRELGPVLGAYHPVDRLQRAAAAGDFGPRRGVVPHVGHRGGDAGGAAGALPHAPHRTWCGSAAPTTAGGATCSRASAIRCRRARPTR